MTTSPTLTYSLEEILLRFEQNMDRKFAEVNQKFAEVNQKLEKIDSRFDKIDERLGKLEIGQAELSGEIKTLDEKVSGINKRLDNQEFINRGVLVSLIVALIGGVAKLFGWLPVS